MEPKIDKKADEIINSHILYSMTAAAIPIPLADIIAVTAIQLDMIKQLANHYSVGYDENKGKSIITSLTGATLARVGASVVKSIPGVGTLAGIGFQMIFSGASTYALGYIFSAHFTEKGTFDNLNIDKIKDTYNSLYEKGKKLAEKLKKKFKNDDASVTIEKLNDLKNKGMITDKEFEEYKKKLLDKLSS